MIYKTNQRIADSRSDKLLQISSKKNEAGIGNHISDSETGDRRQPVSGKSRTPKASVALQAQLIHQYRSIEEVRSDRRALRSYAVHVYGKASSASFAPAQAKSNNSVIA